jgi:hypothetical protein
MDDYISTVCYFPKDQDEIQFSRANSYTEPPIRALLHQTQPIP